MVKMRECTDSIHYVTRMAVLLGAMTASIAHGQQMPADYDQALSVLNQDADLLQQVGPAAKALDRAKVQQLQTQGEALTKQADALATKLGLSECGK